MRPFAVVSGDHNPIHTDRAAALLAGLESPIVHGMWLSAAAQHVATATDGTPAAPAKLVGWTARFLGMVLPGDEVDFRVDRVGIDQGAEVLEISARVGSDLEMVGDGAPRRSRRPSTPSRARAFSTRAWAWRSAPARRPPARCGTAPTSSPARPSASRCCTSCATTRPA